MAKRNTAAEPTINNEHLPTGHNDPASPFYVTEELRAHYKPKPTNGSLKEQRRRLRDKAERELEKAGYDYAHNHVQMPRPEQGYTTITEAQLISFQNALKNTAERYIEDHEEDIQDFYMPLLQHNENMSNAVMRQKAAHKHETETDRRIREATCPECGQSDYNPDTKQHTRAHRVIPTGETVELNYYGEPATPGTGGHLINSCHTCWYKAHRLWTASIK